VSPGKWEVVFARKSKGKAVSAEEPSPLESELTRRGITAQVAKRLVKDFPVEKVKRMVALHDWYLDHGQGKGPGFLVAGIRSEEDYVFPEGFQKAEHRVKLEDTVNTRKRPERELRRRVRVERQVTGSTKDMEPFSAFWSALGEEARSGFEMSALAAADPMKRDGYRRAKTAGGRFFAQYRRVILRDHFERLQAHSETIASFKDPST